MTKLQPDVVATDVHFISAGEKQQSFKIEY